MHSFICLFFFSLLKTRRSRGYCFIYFESLKSAIRAVESSYHLRIDNRSVRVDYSITNHPRSPGTYERYKEEINRNYDNSRHRSYRRAHSPSPRRKHFYCFLFIDFFKYFFLWFSFSFKATIVNHSTMYHLTAM